MTGHHHHQVMVQPRGARSNPARRVVSTRSGASQRLLHLDAGEGITLHYLLDVLLFFTLQDTQEVLQLGHGEGMPLQVENRKNCISVCWVHKQPLEVQTCCFDIWVISLFMLHSHWLLQFRSLSEQNPGLSHWVQHSDAGGGDAHHQAAYEDKLKI